MQIIGKCPKCGYFLTDSDVQCPYCGHNLNKKEEPTLEDELEKFNWAAFLTGPIWGVCNKVWISLIILPFCCIRSNFIFGIILFLYSYCMGVFGNRLAWKKQKYMSIEIFQEEQKKWILPSIFLTIPYLIIMTLAQLGCVFLYIISKNLLNQG